MRIYQLLAIAALCAVVSSSSEAGDYGDKVKFLLLKMMKLDPLFQGFSESQLIKIVEALKEEEKIKKGTVVVKQGTPSKSFYVIYYGWFDVFVGSKKARTLKSVGSFGELGLLEGGHATATVVAKSDGVLFSLDKQSFDKLVGKYIESKDLIYKAKEYV